MKRWIMLICTVLMLAALSPRVFATGTMDTAAELPYSEVILGSVSESNPVDYFHFRVNTDRRVSVNVDVVRSGVQVYILNNDGEPMAYDTIDSTRYDSINPECAMAVTLPPGTFYICITYTGTELNEYTLTLTESKNVASCTHIYSAAGVMITDITPSCSRSGYKLRTCMTCGYQWKTDFMDPRHSVYSWTVTREATCDEDGSRTGTCVRCDETVNEEIPALGHSFTELQLTTAPTDTRYGSQRGICSVCEESVSEMLSPLGDVSLSTYTVPEGYTAIGSFAFKNCEGVSKIILPDTVIRIEDSAFDGCTNLSSINIPSQLTYLGKRAFNRCSALSCLITLPSSLSEIGEDAFRDCTSLSTIVIPSSVTSIGSGAFGGCVNLSSVKIRDIAAWCNIQFGDAFSNPLRYAVTFDLNGKTVTDLVIPKGVTHIGSYAFTGYRMLDDVTIPDSVTQLGCYVFCNSGINNITIPDSVTELGYGAFSNSDIESVTIGDGVEYIENSAFENCSSLKTVELGSGILEIGYMAFRNCEQLESILLSDCLAKIDSYAFEGCSSLEEITFPASISQFGYTVFLDCTSLKTVFFLGDAPASYSGPFPSSVATGYYPAGNSTWTNSKMNDFGRWIQWNPCIHEFPSSSCDYRGFCKNCHAQGSYAHNYEDATCTTPKTCSLCHSVSGKPLGHKEISIPGKETTCTEEGLTEGSACSVCGLVITQQQPIPTAGHSYTDDRDPSCDVCGQEREITPASVPMHRMYDPNSGEHFYSGSELERDFLVEAGWHYEGVGFNFPVEGAPVHRLYDPVYGEHLYTMDKQEMNRLLNKGWQYEGVAFNSAGTDEVPQYRLHNPNAKRGGYHFTGSEVERDLLISFGWIDQGIGWYSCLD